MGQYYMPCSVDKKQTVYSHDYGSGLKLMEHSWVVGTRTNDFMHVVESLIAEGGAWYGDKILWAGDYADHEPGYLKRKGDHGEEYDTNMYDVVHENKIKPAVVKKWYRYVVNLDTNEYVDKKKIPVNEVYNDEEWRIHPLSVMTCEGNGRGGGDYRTDEENPLIGKWARQRVTVTTRKPTGCTEIHFGLLEK